jgi:hypothetical protein
MDQMHFGTAMQNTFNQLGTKILEAQKHADELRGDHLGALHKELELIDRQSMEELVKSFEEVAKAADVVMKDLAGSWYTFGIGSDGAANALDRFQAQYDSLLAQGKQEQASGLLTGTLDQAKKVLDALKVYRANSGTMLSAPGANADTSAALRAQLVLQKAGLSATDDELKAQQALVQALEAQLHIEGQVAQLKKLDSGNSTKTTDNEMAGLAAAAARQAAESQLRMGQQAISADKAMADAQLEIHRGSLEDRLSSDIDFAGRTRGLQLAGNAAEIAALDKSGKEYHNQLKALNDKALEIQSEYDTKITELKAKSSVEVNARDLQQIEQGERLKIEAETQGGAARLTAINAAIKQEEAAHLQDTSYYRDLLKQRVDATKQEAEEESKRKAEAGRLDAENTEKMGELNLAAEKNATALANSAHHVSAQQRVRQEEQAAQEEYGIKLHALSDEAAALDKSDKDYLNKLKQIQNQEKQLIQQHENELTQIKEKAEEESNARILAGAGRFNDEIAQGLTNLLMRHESFSKMVISLGDQVVSGMLQNALKSIMADDMDKGRDAAKAARKGWLAGAQMPFPANIVMAPLLAATWFTGVMAFAGGTDSVPGVGRGDVVPSMLSPGEGVVPGGVMDGLRNLARSGGLSGGSKHYHAHVHPTYNVNTIDGDGMQGALEKHSDQLQRHVENTLRRMNK